MILLKDKNYQELFLGIDNIFKLLRLDYVKGHGESIGSTQGFRLGIRGFSGVFTDN
jgi:hypothetical protein